MDWPSPSPQSWYHATAYRCREERCQVLRPAAAIAAAAAAAAAVAAVAVSLLLLRPLTAL